MVTKELPKFTIEDVQILNLLRCEPPTLAFDFFGYGGLPRSVFHNLMNKMPNLEDIVRKRLNGEQGLLVDIPASDDVEKKREHIVSYNFVKDVFSVIANTYNHFSNQSDAKYFAFTSILGDDGKDYLAHFVALEVYRGKGDGHPIWEFGFYITEPGKGNILHGEETVVDVPRLEDRIFLYKNICNLISRMKGFVYGTALHGINRSNANLEYITTLTDGNRGLRVIDHDEFNQNRAKWFRYLQGTGVVKKVLKFEDRCGYKKGYRNYRVELISAHLTGAPEERYFVDVLADTEEDVEHPNERILREGPYQHEEALERFLAIGNIYLDLMYLNAQKGRAQFNIGLNSAHIDFSYLTIVIDNAGMPITVSSWETPYADDKTLLPKTKGQQTMRHYLQLWNCEPKPLTLYEGVNFKEGVHPRSFMKQMISCLKTAQYDPETFVRIAQESGIPLIEV